MKHRVIAGASEAVDALPAGPHGHTPRDDDVRTLYQIGGCPDRVWA